MNEVETIAEWQCRFRKGEFNTLDRFQDFINIGWRKWFCDFAELRKQTKFLGEIISCIDGKRFSLNECYLRLVSHSLLNGTEYDSINIYDTKTDDIVFQITYTYGSRIYAAYCDNNWKLPTIKTSNPAEFVRWLNL